MNSKRFIADQASEDSRLIIGGKFSPRLGAKTAFFAWGTYRGTYRFHD
jgi:hypothetical protein